MLGLDIASNPVEAGNKHAPLESTRVCIEGIGSSVLFGFCDLQYASLALLPLRCA